MESFLKAMKALSDANRVKILMMLQHKSLCVCEIQAALGIAQPTVSKHLKALLDSGLVEWSRDGKWIDYRLAVGNSNPYAPAILDSLRGWLEQDPSVSAVIEQIPRLCREKLCNSGTNGDPDADDRACGHSRSEGGRS